MNDDWTSGVVVVVGASIGGVRAAQALRREGFAGSVILIGAERDLPYDKPPLSKQLLAGQWEADRVTLLTREAAAETAIELRLGKAAIGLDLGARQVLLDDDSVVNYDKLVIATGASARRPPWGVGNGIHTLRSLADAERLHADLTKGGPVVVVGGGFIGAEVAATARQLGCDVTVVDPLATPISRVLGASVAGAFTAIHERHGTKTRFGVGVRAIDRRRGHLVAYLEDGSELLASTVVVGIGTTLNTGWLLRSGLDVDDGVRCDSMLRACGADAVYAVGDIARWHHRGYGEDIRIEHWTNAVESAGIAAHNIVHRQDSLEYQPVTYVWSDQYDWKIQVVGRPAQASTQQVVGDLRALIPKAAVLCGDDAGALVGMVAVNWPKALVAGRRTIVTGGTVADASAQLEDSGDAFNSPSASDEAVVGTGKTTRSISQGTSVS